jgi:hypothetical protein
MLLKSTIRTVLLAICVVSFISLHCSSPTSPTTSKPTLPSYTVQSKVNYGFWAAGDNNIILFVNGTQIDSERASGVFAPISDFQNGVNVIAVRVRNVGLGGGFLAGMAQCTISTIIFPTQFDSAGDTLAWDTLYDTLYTQAGVPQSDTGWKYSFGDTVGCTAVNFNDANWQNVDDYGDVKIARQKTWGFDTGATARWVYNKREMYYRKKFTADSAGPATFHLCSWWNGGAAASLVNVYVNGQKIVDSSDLGADTNIYLTRTTSVVKGDNVIAIAMTDTTQGDGPQFVCQFRAPSQGIWIVSDSTWRCYDRPVNGWMTASFDDASWDKVILAGYGLITGGNFRIMWGDSTRKDTTISDTPKIIGTIDTFYSADSSMVFWDTTWVNDTDPAHIVQIDTFKQLRVPSNAQWLNPPWIMYLRYKFNLTIQ